MIFRFIVFALLALAIKPAFSQTDTIRIGRIPHSVLLKEAVIKAYKADKHMPVTFKNVSKSAIERINVGQEPSHIFSFSPAINSYSDAGNYQGYSYFRLRGIDQTRINMTLDGIPLNEPEDQGAYFSNYPDFLNSVQSLQIQRGVGTSTNGVASYAGSMNFSSPELREEEYTELGINYGSYNTFRLYGEFQRRIQKDKAVYARISHISSDGYKYHSGNQSNSVFLSSAWYKNKQTFKFTGFAGNQKNQLAWMGVPLNTLKKNGRINGNSDENDHFFQALASIQHTFALSSHIRINSVVYYNYLKGNYDFDLNNFLGLPLNEEMYNYAFEHHFTGFFSNLQVLTGRMKFYSGIHVNTFNRIHTGSEKTIGELYQNTGYKNGFSAFAKMNYKLGMFYLFADLQYRYTTFKYKGSVDLNAMAWNFVNPKVGMSYFLGSRTNIYYSFGTNGREPTRNDIFNGEDDLLSDSLGNPLYSNVLPERVFNHEMGIKTMHTKWYLFANVYRMNFTREIVLNGQFGPNGLPLHSNVARSSRNGLEIDFGYHILSVLKYSTNISCSYNRINEEEISIEPVLTPRFIWNQEFVFHKKSIEFALSGKFQSSSYIDFENSTKLPSFIETNMRFAYSIKEISIALGINNLTNTEILANGYMGIDGTPLYFVQAPRNYFMALTWKI
jgi:iron complex outermembrane recepter protein